MQNSDSLKWERYVLDLIYDGEPELFVEHADSPDFLMRRDGYVFGVEITELFKDGSSARLVKLPDYMQHLWDGGAPIHKDDVNGINVVTIRIQDSSGNVVQDNVKAIFSESGTLRDHADALAEHLERKNAAYVGYDHSLGHINLIIGDHFSSGESIGAEYSTADFFTPRLRAALRSSPFREVFLITNILYDEAAWVPLRQLELMESFMVFVYCVFRSAAAVEALDEEDLVHLFALEMESVGEPVALVQDAAHVFAARGGASVRYAVEHGTLVHDYADWPLSDRVEVERREVYLPAEDWSFIQAEHARARGDGAGVDLAYVRPVRAAAWPFDSARGTRTVTAERIERPDAGGPKGSPTPA